jgi:hypothetical protein
MIQSRIQTMTKGLFSNAYKLILFSSVFLSACLPTASIINAKQPDWLNGESSAYPNAQYVVASGSASDAETAQKRAQANLAKVFELRIRESATTTQDVQSHRVNGVESVNSKQRINSQINVSTDKLIEGARIAEQWQNPDDRTYYALAVLDRHQAGNSIRSEIERLDKETGLQLKKAESEHDSLLKVADIESAITNQQQRTALQKTLKVIDLNGRGMPAQWSQTELTATLQTALSALHMQAIVKRDHVGGLVQILRGAMAQAGFVSTNSASGYRLVLDVDAQPGFQQQGWYWQRGTMNLQLETPDGTVRGQKSWPLKVSASRPDQLNARLRTSIEKILKTQLSEAVFGFVTVD